MLFVNITLLALSAYLGFSACYLLFFTLASLGRNSRVLSSGGQSEKPKIAVFIPAYREDAVIFSTTRQSTNQNYPEDRYDVYVIADQLQEETISQLKKTSAMLVELDVKKSSKTIALNSAMESIKDQYDLAVVLDADNIMDSNFLSKVATAYTAGSKAIQGHRIAKNKQNNLAYLDAISEEINNSIFRKGHVNLGFSSALIGSAMAFDYRLFKEEMAGIQALGGFDKELEIRLLEKGIFIDYLEDALVYDEKVANMEVFKNQRTRWIAAQIRYGIKYTSTAIYNLFTKSNFDLFDKIIQFWIMPRLMMLGITFIVASFSLLISSGLFSFVFGGILLTQMLSLLLAVPRHFYTRKLLKSLLALPGTFITMIIASFGYRKAQKNFLHTPKSQAI